jgi:hypothetical protein
MNATQTNHWNSPVKNCRTCVHGVAAYASHPDYDRCLLCHSFCKLVMTYPNQHPRCQNFSGWRPRPPKPARRSLRQWLYDVFLKMQSKPTN